MKKIKTIINDKNKYFDYRGERCIVIHNPGVMNKAKVLLKSEIRIRGF